MDPITVRIAPEPNRARVLMMVGGDEVMRAILGPPGQAHPRAAATLLEGLSLWYQRRLAVVLSVEELSTSCGLALYDGLGFGDRSVHYDVGVALPGRRRRARRLGGLGDFRDLRELSLGVAP